MTGNEVVRCRLEMGFCCCDNHIAAYHRCFSRHKPHCACSHTNTHAHMHAFKEGGTELEVSKETIRDMRVWKTIDSLVFRNGGYKLHNRMSKVASLWMLCDTVTTTDWPITGGRCSCWAGGLLLWSVPKCRQAGGTRAIGTALYHSRHLTERLC